MKTAVIIDFDGTLYDCEERRKRCFPPGGKKDFERWNAEASLDPMNAWCGSLVHAMRHMGHEILFVSGRESKWVPDAAKWLKKNLNLSPGDYRLWMRRSGDYRPDVEIKREIFEGDIKHCFDVLFAVDDRKCVVDMWRGLGVVCLQCAEGDF